MGIDVDYRRPETLAEAAKALSINDKKATVISGGQSLLPELRQQSNKCDTVVDVNNIDGFDYIEKDNELIKVGFLVRYVDIMSSELIERYCGVLSRAVKRIGDVQVRNRGTLCGGIAQADPSGDPPVLSHALRANIVTSNGRSTKIHDATSFFSGPYQTVLDKNEIITEVQFPVIDNNQGIAYERYTGASNQAYPVATVAAEITLDNRGIIENARIVTGVIESQPVDMNEAAIQLEDEEPTDALMRSVAQVVGENSNPTAGPDGSPEFKSEIIKTLTKNALVAATNRASENR